jgi:imidazolonepropionase
MLVIKNIAQILTLQGGPAPRVGSAMAELGIIQNGTILVRADRITWVGPTKDLPVRDLSQRYQILDGMGLDLVALPVCR